MNDTDIERREFITFNDADTFGDAATSSSVQRTNIAQRSFSS
jgi:hypothetical protein